MEVEMLWRVLDKCKVGMCLSCIFGTGQMVIGICGIIPFCKGSSQ